MRENAGGLPKNLGDERDAKARHDLVYFSVADRQMEGLLKPYAFEVSLVYNALFQPGILIPDIFCFISAALASHVLRSSRQSLFAACVERGIVIPTFRSPDISSFQDDLRLIRGAGDPRRAILGVRDDAEQVAYRLQAAADRNSGFLAFTWPQHHVGEKFSEVVERYLSREEPPEVGEDAGSNTAELDEYWKLTAVWRRECADEARGKTRQMGDKGLRRGELMNAVGRRLGLGDDCQVHDVAQLLRQARSPKEAQALRFFCKWMSECYQYNQAIEFGATPSFSCYDPLGGLMVTAILPSRPPILDPPPVPTICETVPLPPMKVLMRMSPDQLVGVRRDLGDGYLAAVRRWQDEPSTNAEKEVRRTLREYAELISTKAAKERNFCPAFLDVVLGATKQRSREILIENVKIVSNMVGVVAPLIRPFVALGRPGYELYRLLSERPEETTIEVRGVPSTSRVQKTNRDADVNL